MSCIQIKDGTGKSYLVKVNGDNHLMARVVSESSEHYANHSKGVAYSLRFSQTPTGANDCFFYFKNTGTKSIVFEGFSIYAATAEAIDVKVKDTGTPSGGSTITPVNLNTGSSTVFDATVQEGADITGLSGGSVAYRFHVQANSQTNHFNFEQDIILAPQTVLTMYAVNGAIAINGQVDVHLISEES